MSPFQFAWQIGYAAFSYSRSQVPAVATYIENQDEHPRKKSFREEYIEMLQKAEMEFEERYLFDFWEDVVDWD
ncbi:MAG: hypothetical protein ABIO24_10140 [Saprospiraceae bacterium]